MTDRALSSQPADREEKYRRDIYVIFFILIGETSLFRGNMTTYLKLLRKLYFSKVLITGFLTSVQMLRRVVIGSFGVAVLVPTVSAATPIPAEPKGPACPPLMKPSELPIYEAPHAEYGE